MKDIVERIAEYKTHTPEMLLNAALEEIRNLRSQVRSRGKLLADIFNHPDVDLPMELHQRVDRVLMFGKDTQPQASAVVDGG